MGSIATSPSLKDDGTPSRQRVQIVDALRGLALVGMLLVHFQYYVKDDGVWSLRVNHAVDFLAVGRFYALFAFLFGVGFTLQFTRWGDRPGFVRMYVRRLCALMLFAAAVTATTGYRVLEAYAFWGLALLLVRHWSNRALVILALLCAFSRPAAEFAVWSWESQHITVNQSNTNVRQEWRRSPDFHREDDRLRDERNFAQLAVNRLRFAFGDFLRWRAYVPSDPFLLFIAGMLAVRLRVLQEPLRHRDLLLALILYGLVAGVLAQFVGDWFPYGSSGLRLTQAKRYLCYAIFDERFQGLAYGAVLLLLTARSATSPAFLRLLAATGRLSLTNYVLQLVILETLFASSTPYISLNRWTGLLGVIIVFWAQIIFSRWWMARFRFGPLEWLWRSMTFARWEPLRREQARTAAA